MGEGGDERGDGEDQVAGAAFLHLFAVDGAAEFEVVGVGELVRGDQPRSLRGEPGVGFSETELWCGTTGLGDAFGDVLSGGESGDVGPGVGGVDVAGFAADDGDEFDLPVDVAAGGDDHVGVGAGEAGRVFGEDRWQVGGGFEAGFGGVGVVVQADGEHLPGSR